MAGATGAARPAEPAGPAPLVFLAAGTIADAFDPYFAQAAAWLVAEGIACAAIDLPLHGANAVPGQPAELAGWAAAAQAGRDVADEYLPRARSVLDTLIQREDADPARIAVIGTSRAGYLGLRQLADDARIRCGVGYAPVTNLRALLEYRAVDPDGSNPLIDAAGLPAFADRLADRPVLLQIGDHDERVSTDDTIALARRISGFAHGAGRDSLVDLQVFGGAASHTTPPGAAAQSAQWLRAKLFG